jgi:hypothetical protein
LKKHHAGATGKALLIAKKQSVPVKTEKKQSVSTTKHRRA